METSTQEFSKGTATPSVENVQTAGDVFFDEMFITTVNGQQIDIKNFCVQMNLYEDIFSNVMTGTIIIVDALGLITAAPLVGGEFLSIQLRTPGYGKTPNEMIRKTFTIYGISDRILDGDRQQFYTLHFISIEGMQDNVTLLSKGYQGATDALVSQIYNDNLKTPRWYTQGDFTSEQTDLIISGTPHATTVRLVAPYWSPFKTINWISTRTLGQKNKGANFLFFESNKAFYFSSVEDLIEGQRNAGMLFEQYFYSHANFRTETNGYTYKRPDISRDYQIVARQRFPTYIDLIKNQDSGYFSSTMYTHDILLKQYKEWTWDYGNNFNSFQHLEGYAVSNGNITSSKTNRPPFHSKVAKSPVTYRCLRTKQFRMFDDFADPKYQDWALQRNSLLCEISNIRIELDVMGRTDAEAGQLIYYHFPNATDKNQNAPVPDDILISGLYFITAIRHTFTPGKHSMRLEVVKDSFKTAVG